ncbi:UDP-2,3-diacylglucosamine diphosphatase [Sessilibacter sp. MAH2]
MSTLLISDLHLEESRPQITKAFFRFLSTQASDVDALYILGDLFEAWIGDDDDSEFVRQVKEALLRFTQSGVPTYFIHGNRDFLIGEKFAEETGVTLLQESTVVNFYDEPVLLMHGDTLCTLDQQYMAFREQVRSAQWQAQILSQSIEARRQIAAQLRNQSASMSSNKAEDIMDVTPEEVTSVMNREKVTKLVHGHTHRPARHEFNLGKKPAERIVLGDWDQNGWYLEVKPDNWQLHQFSLSTSSASASAK